MVRMVDVAHHAGVSVKTVSRVMNNERHVKDSVRTSVLKSVEELGYVPSTSARSLRSNRTYSIYLVAHVLDSNYIHAIQAGALLASQKAGYNFLWTYLDPTKVHDADFLERWCHDIATEKRPDGVILVPPYSNNESINNFLRKYNIPIARIGPNSIRDENVTLSIDEKRAAYTATKHLIDLGHKRIAFIRGFEDQDATHVRYNGYLGALKDAGIHHDPKIVFPGEFNFTSGMTAGEMIIAMANRPTAVFAANDDMAAGVIAAAHKNQVKIPQDISVIGFDDSEMAGHIWPALTTIRQPRVDYGKRAVERIVAKIGNKRKAEDSCLQHEMLEHKLIIRDSTSRG